MNTAWRWHLGVILVCGLAIGVVYGPAVRYPYVWTDHAEIEGGGLVPKTFDQVLRFMTEVKGRAVAIAREDAVASRTGGGYFRPAKALSYGLDWRLGGGRPAAFHLTNILIHLLFCVALYFLAHRLYGPEGRFLAALVALWHALAPQHVEVVCWISARSDSLWGLFGLLALLCAVRAADSRHPVALRALAVALAALAVFSKESGVVAAAWPFLFFWLVGRDDRSRLRRAWTAGAWTLLGAVLAAGYRLLFVGGVGSAPTPAGAGAWTRLQIFGQNVFESFFPSGLRLADTVEISPVPSLLALAGWGLALFWIVMAVRQRRDGKALFLFLAFLLALLPVSQIWPLLQPRGERYLYVPAAFAELAAGLAIASLAGLVRARALQMALGISALASLLALGLYSGSRAEAWSDEVRLFSRAVEDEPNCAECWNNLAYARAIAGAYEEAERACRAALEIDRRRYWTHLDGFSVRWILSQLLLLRGEGAEAAFWLAQIDVRVDGGPSLFAALARARLLSGEAELALQAAERGLARYPDNAPLRGLRTEAEALMIASGHDWMDSRPQCRPAR